MNYRIITPLLACFFCWIFNACSVSKYSYKTKNETVNMKIEEDVNYLALLDLKNQDGHELASGRKSQGFFFPMVKHAVSVASLGISNLIKVQQAKYTAAYGQQLSEMYFYDRISETGTLDPSGIQFKGFTFIRLVELKKGKTDTAMIAEFVVDTSNLFEVFNSSYFKLRLKSLDIRYSKAKMPATKWYVPWSWGGRKKDNLLNMDIEIVFKSSYALKNGSLFYENEIGRFTLPLRNIPMKPGPEREDFFSRQENKLLKGFSFIVPRSYGFMVDKNGKIMEAFNQGKYSIDVNVKEAGKEKFLTKVMTGYTDKILQRSSDKFLDITKPLLTE